MKLAMARHRWVRHRWKEWLRPSIVAALLLTGSAHAEAPPATSDESGAAPIHVAAPFDPVDSASTLEPIEAPSETPTKQEVPLADTKSTPAALPTAATIEDEDPGAAAPPEEVPEKDPVTLAESVAPDADDWTDRIDSLLFGLATGELTSADADRLYWELDQVLWPYHRAVRHAIDAGDSDFIELDARLVELFSERNRLFEVVSPGLRSELRGGGPLGRTALHHELSYLHTTFRSQLLVVREGTDQIASNFSDAPLTTFWSTLQILIAIVVFRVWRRWSNRGLPEARSRLLEAQPRQAINLRLAGLLWYLHRIGGPLAWLILILFVSRVVEPRGFEELVALLTTILIWVFLARLAVQLIDAMVARNVGGLSRERSDLRLRSLRLIAAWSLILALGLTLVGRYVGHGAIYGWVVRAWQMLSIPVVLLLIQWWRAEINERLEALADQSDWARRLAGRRQGFGSYPFAVAGAVYVLWAAAFRRFVRLLSGWDSGRRVLAVLVRREVARDVSGGGHEDESPIGEEIVTRVLGARDLVQDDIASQQLATIGASLRAERGGGYVVLGERGAGKTVFLDRLARSIGDAMLLTSCPTGGYEAFEASLASRLGLKDGADLQSELPAAIARSGTRWIGVDNAQRLARPWIGGQKGLDQLAALDAKLNSEIGWVLTVDRRAWQYILSSRGERALFQQVIELPTWTEVQLAELVRARARAAGIDPDYSRLVLPRQLDAGEHDSLEERNRLGYARILWELADGNPEVALYLFVASMRNLPDDRVILRLPQPSFSAALTQASIDTLLVLRAVTVCDVATLEDLCRSLRMSERRARSIARFCQQNGWLDADDDGFRIRWESFRMVTRALVRQNLMPR
ncbi:MAG: hypothetical protein JRG92_20530 [Deltaproteobacteria bacterium]|nr:hypothetical protein [Deltaproteobacteria bacterium]